MKLSKSPETESTIAQAISVFKGKREKELKMVQVKGGKLNKRLI
jgi:hypothetical protein